MQFYSEFQLNCKFIKTTILQRKTQRIRTFCKTVKLKCFMKNCRNVFTSHCSYDLLLTIVTPIPSVYYRTTAYVINITLHFTLPMKFELLLSLLLVDVL